MKGPVVGGYVHSTNKIASVVALTAGDAELARDIAMHAAAVNPRVAKPEEVAYTILFLASDGAEFTTGAIVDLNGASYLRT